MSSNVGFFLTSTLASSALGSSFLTSSALASFFGSSITSFFGSTLTSLGSSTLASSTLVSFIIAFLGCSFKLILSSKVLVEVRGVSTFLMVSLAALINI